MMKEGLNILKEAKDNLRFKKKNAQRFTSEYCTNQWCQDKQTNCVRMDVMSITLIYFLYQSNVLT